MSTSKMEISMLLLTLALRLLMGIPFTAGVARTFPEVNTVDRLAIDKSKTQETSGNLNSVSMDFKHGIQFNYNPTPLNYLLFESGPSEDNVVLYHDGKTVSYIVKNKTANSMVYTGSVSMDTSKEWHKVSLTFDNVKAMLQVDGASHYNFMGYLPKIADKVYLYKLEPITSLDIIISPFVGCLDNFNLNGANLQASGDLFIAFAEGCSFPPSLVSLAGAGSYLNYTIDASQNFRNVTMDIKLRTFTTPSVIALFTLDDPVSKIEVIVSGAKEVQVVVGTTTSTTITYTTDKELVLTDGNYHELNLEIALSGVITLTVDMNKQMTTTATSPLFTEPGTSKYVNMEIGSSPGSTNPFTGCVSGFRSSLEATGNDKVMLDLSHFTNNTVVLGTCEFKDRCLYGVCANSVPCSQTMSNYRCECDSVWEGFACNTPKVTEETCTKPIGSSPSRSIDTDGAGPISGFTVNCVVNNNEVWTQVLTTNAADVAIAEADYPYNSTIEYGATLQQIRSLIDRNTECRQSVKYTCTDSKLFTLMSNSQEPYAFWIGGDAKEHKYWGGSNATQANPCAGDTVCQCDSAHTGSVIDQGFLTTQEHLPVTEVSFKATTKAGEDMSASYTIGPLECKNDVLLSDDSAITFLGEKAAKIKVPLGDAPAELSFKFKTTNTNSYLLHSEVIKLDGYPDVYLAIGLSGSNSLFVSLHYMDIQIERFPVSFESALDRNFWHTVYLELSHEALSITVDNEAFTVWTRGEFIPYLKLYPTMFLYVGGAPNEMMTYSGCIKNLRVQGQYIDLHQYAMEDSIKKGCVGACSSNPCLNGGKCTEYYTSYSCDCTGTGYMNCYCGKDSTPSIVISNNSTVELTSPVAQLNGKVIYHMGFETNSTDSTVLTFQEAGGPNMILSIDTEGKLIGNLTSGTTAFNTMFDTKVNDETPHYVSLVTGGTTAAPTLTLQLDGTDKPSGDFGQPFNTASPVSHTLTYGETVVNESKSFDGCLFLVELGETRLDLTIAALTGTVINGDCAPSVIPEYLISRRDGLAKIVDDSNSKSNARQPPTVKYLSVLPPSTVRYDQNTDVLVVSLVQPVTLHCEVMGSPMPRIIWKKDNSELETNCFNRLNNSTLQILPDESSAGMYRCEAVNSWGTSYSNEAYKLVRPTLQAATTTPADVPKAGIEGNSLELACDSVTSEPPATVIWEIVSGTGATAAKSVKWPGGPSVNQRIVVLETDKLLFRDLTVVDDNTVRVVCYRVNPISGVRRNTNKYTLTVMPNADPNYKDAPPSILTVSSSPVILRESQDLTLHCTIQDFKSPFETPMWYHNNVLIDSVMYSSGETLHLKNVTVDKEGVYTCKLNSTGDTKNITVQIQSIPKWSNRPGMDFKYKGSDVTFSCKLQDENYTTAWFSNGKPVTAKDRYTFNDTTLTIKNVSKEADLQTISCEAKQYGITLRAEGFLNVVDNLKVTEPKDIMLSKENNGVEFRVIVVADPVLPVTYTWMKDDAPLSNLKPEKSVLSTILTIEDTSTGSLLRLDTSKFTEDDNEMFKGKYSCKVSDTVSMVTVQSILFINPDNENKENGTDEKDDGLSVGAIIGIILASVVGFTIIAGVIGYLCYNSHKANRKYGMTDVGAYKNPAYAS